MSHNKSIPLRLQDPHLAREIEKYGHALPSREWILQFLQEEGVPVALHVLFKRFDIAPDEEEAFEVRIRAMVRDGQLYINRRRLICVADKLDLVICRVQAHHEGFGFAVPLEEKSGPDFVLGHQAMRVLMNGDIISMRATSYDRKGRREGRVIEILQRKYKELVCRLYVEEDVAIALPVDAKITQTLLLPNTSVETIQNGEVAVVIIDRYPDKVNLATGHIKEVLGSYVDPGMEIEIAVRKHELPYRFPAATLQEAASIPQTISEEEITKRRDIRHLPLLTIDGETAKDFDDAVYGEKTDTGYRLVVAIADVSHYVVPGSALDKEAYKRATSVYFPRKVIPMLPEELSNGICSLMPQVDRLCLVCDMKISTQGKIEHYQFYRAVMHSHARLTYDKVWQNLETAGDYPFKKELTTLYDLYKILAQRRKERGAIEFESLSTQMIFDENNKIKKIIPEERNDAHRIIEESMLAANVCAADFILRHKVSALFRVHEGPTSEKLQVLRQQLQFLNVSLHYEGKPVPKDYSRILNELEGRADKSLIEMMLLRSLQPAVYQPENLGHFGLAYKAYTHFTSPIRRYPDLLIHRMIKGLDNTLYRPEKSWVEIGRHCSDMERRAEEAARDVEKWLKTYYMRDKIGEVFSGTISSVTSFGVFVMLDDVYTEGMIHLSELGQDYFDYVPEKLSAIGERTHIAFTLGDPIVVRVVSADLDTCRIDLVLVSGGRKLKKRSVESSGKKFPKNRLNERKKILIKNGELKIAKV